jgi:hypothetical protein
VKINKVLMNIHKILLNFTKIRMDFQLTKFFGEFYMIFFLSVSNSVSTGKNKSILSQALRLLSSNLEFASCV